MHIDTTENMLYISYLEVFFKNGNSKVDATNNAILTLGETQRGI